MELISIAFYSYIFISLYMLFLFILIYFNSRKQLFDYPKGKPEGVSIVMPCYNESETIGQAIESLLKLDYPKKLIEVIVVDDRSNDNSVDIIKKYVKRYSNVKLIVNKRNSGGAAEPTNIGVKAAKFDYIAVADADSTPDRDALKKMIGFLQEDEKVGGVTCYVKAKNRNKFFEKLQAVEYANIAFTRKLLDGVDAVYVTPGPFALYKKKVLIEVGLFDTKNLTQDIEIVWRMVKHGYKSRMCLATGVSSVVPSKFGGWWRQRIRWNLGGQQTILKYKRFLLRKGMLGCFIIPFFVVSLFLGLFGLILFSYLFVKKFLLSYLATVFSLSAGTKLLALSEVNMSPSVLNFFGIILFVLGALFLVLALTMTEEKALRNKSPFMMLFYLLIYLALYPLVLITSVYKHIKGDMRW